MDRSHNVLVEIRERRGDFTLSQMRIADGVLADPEFVAFATVDKLAQRLGVAPSTVVRFAYKLGLDGYPELQELVRQIVRRQLGGDGERSVTHLRSRGLGDSLLRDSDELRRTVASLDAERLAEAVHVLAAASRVCVMVNDESRPIVEHARRKLPRVSIDTELADHDAQLSFDFDPDALVLRTHHRTVVIGVSHSLVGAVAVINELAAALSGVTVEP